MAPEGRKYAEDLMRKVLLVLVLFVSVLLITCTNPAPGGGGTTTPGTGVKVAAFSKGVITAKGSIFVNGVEFDTTTAAVTINGVTSTDASLAVGMQVEVKGQVDDVAKTGSAAQIQYDACLDAPISAISPASNTMMVLGQTVLVSPSTSFSSPLTGLTDLKVNDVVEVGGIPDGAGVIHASAIELKAAATEYEACGVVSSLGASSFMLTLPNNGPAIQVSFTGTLAAAIANGVKVEVKFSTLDVATLTVTTTAAKIEPKTELAPAEGDLTEVQGFVTGLNSAKFSVEGVSVDASTVSLTGIIEGTKVAVKGTIANGVLVATKIDKSP